MNEANSNKYTISTRDYVSKNKITGTLDSIRVQAILKRYLAIRRFCYGKVLDFACGCGYGAELLSVSPEIESILGVDRDQSAIEWAKKEFANDKCNFISDDIKTIHDKFDTLVCVETIEHVNDVQIVKELIEQNNIDNLIVSFPDKKSSHYNTLHLHDFVLQDIVDMFPKHILYYKFRLDDVQFVLLVKAPEKFPSFIYRNIHNL